MNLPMDLRGEHSSSSGPFWYRNISDFLALVGNLKILVVLVLNRVLDPGFKTLLITCLFTSLKQFASVGPGVEESCPGL